jgi:hypothetical protein
MSEFDSTNNTPDLTNAGKSGDPPSKKRRKPLDSLEAVRREMTSTYWDMKEDKLELDEGKARIYVLGKITEVLKAEQGPPDEELIKLLKLVKGNLI